MTADSFDRWLQRAANLATIVGLAIALVGGYLAYKSLWASLESLKIAREQTRPIVKITGRVFIDRALRKPSMQLALANTGPGPARDVVIHFEAIFRNETKPQYLGQLPIGEVEVGNRPLDSATLATTLVDWLKRAVPVYDPSKHGPSKLNVYLEFHDATGSSWGGVDETGKDRRGAARTDLDLQLEK